MKVRLGFAIAAHLEPEILIVDEVLAVGDAEFQAKCLGKMQSAANTGRTVLFVSHNMDAIRTLCPRTILLQNGKMLLDGNSMEVIKKYHQLLKTKDFNVEAGLGDNTLRRGSGDARISSIKIYNRLGIESSNFPMEEDVYVNIKYEVYNTLPCLYVMLALRSGKTNELITTSVRHPISKSTIYQGTKGVATIKLPSINIRPGEYPLYIGLANDRHKPIDIIDGLIPPLIVSTDKTIEDLGYDPTKPCGFFNLNTELNIS
jgi:lipopolysaccharide transport system ATP-binding protein